jgi:UDP-N-acetylglucosamine acyltransferase
MKDDIHPTAVVDSAAALGAGAAAGPHVVVGPDVQVGEGTQLLAGTVVTGPSRIGSGNRIGPTASLGSDPQDLKYAGERTELVVGDNNRIREFSTINRGTEDGGGVTRMGDDNLLMAYSHVAHDCVVGSNVVISHSGTLGGHVTVGDWSVVGAFSSVHPFCRVGEHSYTGGYCVLTRDVPPYLRVVGERDTARTIGVNSVGLARRGFSEETIVALKRAYRIFRRDGRLDKLLDEILDAQGSVPEVRRLVEFCRSSERGVIR